MLDLDRTIASYGTSLRLPGHAEQQAKVADILSHRLGLARNAYDGRLESGVDPVEIRHELGALTPICPPGTCHSYQNVAYDTIAEIIARATRHSYADMVRTQLFEPLHMTGASIGMADLTCARSWARPYRNGYPVKLTDAYYRVPAARSEEQTSELQSLMRISYAVFCLKKKKKVNLYTNIDKQSETQH